MWSKIKYPETAIVIKSKINDPMMIGFLHFFLFELF